MGIILLIDLKESIVFEADKNHYNDAVNNEMFDLVQGSYYDPKEQWFITHTAKISNCKVIPCEYKAMAYILYHPTYAFKGDPSFSRPESYTPHPKA